MASPDMDINMIFDKFTIEEIRNIEKKTRLDIERKKEDLRQMVGERYRDLIDAADTITSMKTSADNVMKSVNKIQEYCQTLKQNQMIKGVSVSYKTSTNTNKKRTECRFLSIAAQIKLLLDTPERIWTELDSSEYLKATQLYLVARHVHTSLQLDTQQSTAIHTWFPVLTRQWTAISHFRASILQECRQVLKDSSKPVKVITNSLCSIILLEDSNPRQVFYEFLLARSNSILQLFKLDQQSNSIKSQICSVVNILCTTIQQIYQIFHSDDEEETTAVNEEMKEETEEVHNNGNIKNTNLLVKTLQEISEKHKAEQLLQKDHVGTSILKSVADFQFIVQTPITGISTNQLREKSHQWLETCLRDVTDGVCKLLSYITSIRAMTSIRDDIWNQLSNSEISHDWNSICERVLNRDISIWDDFLRKLFIQRVNEILEGQFDNALLTTNQHLEKILNEIIGSERTVSLDSDLTTYVWKEHISDIASGAAWTPSISKSLADAAGLTMKSKMYTPNLQTLCKNLDNKLKSLLEDMSYYTTAPPGETHRDAATAATGGVFDRTADNLSIHSFLQNTCELCIKRLLGNINSLVTQYKSLLSSSRQQALIDGILFCGRLCQAIGDLCPNIQQCIIGLNKQSDTVKSNRRHSSLTTSKSKTAAAADDPKWTTIKQLLSDESLSAYKVWRCFTSDSMITQLKQCLLDTSLQGLLHNSTKWDEVSIEEESESGRVIRSSIHIPMQVSPYIQTFLYNLCTEINRIGGHTVNRKVLCELIEQTTDELVNVYSECIKPPIDGVAVVPFTQNRALQMLFDIRFISYMFPRKDDSATNKLYQKKLLGIIEDLENHIDPFDLDVFMPYVQSHLTKLTQRCSMLYGSIAGLDKPVSITSRSTPSSTTTSNQEQHSIIQLTNNQTRFSLLPLSTTNLNKSHITIPKLNQPTVNQSMTDLSDFPPEFQNLPPKRNESFYNRLGTIWFSNIGGK
ncbi:conserved oligomeric Golgi complex subunit 1-like isoform X2 [Tubulanus polymorphus]|uniref:conserved oligomeric Golgi complex subunit 1-like isoform X2 n=1 Tax=Tubulanus polymorphus TaxID=672921 RepID=UPI003DA2C102